MPVTTPVPMDTGRSGVVRKVATYAASSVVATVCSELTLVVCYGVLHVHAGLASVLAWLAGAVPNYVINRRYTWQRSGRPSLRREVLPYVCVVLFTLVIAVSATHLVSAAARNESVGTRTTLVAVTFLGVYVLMFAVRYFLFDRLFGRLAASEQARTEPVRSADQAS